MSTGRDDLPEGFGGDEGEGGEEGEREPLAAEERESVEDDLHDLAGMRAVFESDGVKGVVIACSECGSNHYYGWDMLQESLQHMLETGEPRMHEPPYAPNEEDYVVWDYAKGYVDALADAGLDPESRIDLSMCPWCATALDPNFSYCPSCGRSLAIARLYLELVERGMSERTVRELLVRAGFEPVT